MSIPPSQDDGTLALQRMAEAVGGVVAAVVGLVIAVRALRECFRSLKPGEN